MQGRLLDFSLFRACLLVVILSMTALGMHAQRTLTGQVKSAEDSLGMPGVTVLLAGTTVGTITDIDGKFSLPMIVAADSIEFTSIGYATQTLAINNSGSYAVWLAPEVTQLKGFVVTALGISKEKKGLGYSVGEVDMEAGSKARDVNLVNTMQGKVSGVQVTSTSGGPGSSTRIVIRGNGSIVNNNQPLVVVDGVPIDNTTIGTGSTWGGIDFGSPISDINPDDVETFTVLKGPNAAALYGSRALNGAIIITTKRGEKGRKLGVNFSSTFSLEQANIVKDFQDEFGAGTRGELRFDSEGIAMFETNRPTLPTYSASWGPRYDDQQYIDWDGEERTYSAQPDNYRDNFRTGMTTTNNVSVSTTGKIHTTRFSYTHLWNRGISPNNTFRRHNASVSSRVTITKKLSTDISLNYARQAAENRISLSNSANFARNVIMMPRNVSAASLADFEDDQGNEKVWFDGWNWIGNPYFELNRNTNNDHRDRLIGKVSATYQVLPWLSVRGQAGGDYFEEFRESRIDYGSWIVPRGRLNNTDIDWWERNTDILITANRAINDNWEFTLSAGGNRMYQRREQRSQQGDELLEPDVYDFDNFDPNRVVSNTFLFEKKINSVYSSGQLIYNRYLYFDFTARNDWSSTLPPQNNSYFYPSVSMAYAFTEHQQIIPHILSFGKVRLSWAQVGKDADPYLLQLVYDSLATFNGVQLDQVHNPFPLIDLEPELKSSWEVGADLRFFGNRLGVDATFYWEKTTNQILNSTISATSGFNSAVVNAGEIRNRGVELLVTGKPIVKKNFEWNVSVNFTRNVNEVVELNEDVQRQVLGNQWRVDVTAAEGYPYGAIFGYGIQRDANGNRIMNADGTFLRTEEQIFLGDVNPDFLMGVTNSFKWKRFTGSFLVDIKQGGKIYSASNMYLHGYSGNVQATVEGRDGWYASEADREAAGVAAPSFDGDGNYVIPWNPTGGYEVNGVYAEGTIINGQDVSGQTATRHIDPQDYWSQFAAWTQEIHEPFVYDASFVKLREVLIGYELPASVTSKVKLRGLTVSLVGRNLWLIYSAVPNIDPEATYSNGNGQGVEWATYPITRSFGINLKARI